MFEKKAQIELAIIKGLVISLFIIGGFILYESVEAKMPNGDSIICNWNCQDATWGDCIDGLSYRDVSLCLPSDGKCFDSEPLPTDTMNC